MGLVSFVMRYKLLCFTVIISGFLTIITRNINFSQFFSNKLAFSNPSNASNAINSSYTFENNIEQLITVPLLRKDPSSIIYIKTIKTASSTITNLLHTYAVRHNKSCLVIAADVYHKNKYFNFNKSKHKQQKLVSELLESKSTWNKNKSLDIWLDHVQYHPYLFELIPSSKNQIVTILREPNQRLISALNYFGNGQNKFERHELNITQYIDQNRHVMDYWGMNSQCMSLIPGLVEKGIDEYNAWQKIMSGEFLLLITERFNESLLLLKYAYNLSWNDLFFGSMKIKNKNHTKYVLTQKEESVLKKLLKCDWKLYHMAQRIFDYRLYQIYEGNKTKMQNDINIMKQYRYKQQLVCDSIDSINQSNYTQLSELVCQSSKLDQTPWNKWAETVIQRI